MLQADPDPDWRAESAPERVGELLLFRISYRCLLGDRLVRTWPSHPTSPKAQSAALPPAARRGVVHAPPAVGFGIAGSTIRIGTGARLRREFSGEPDVGNLHLRFDEGRVGRSTSVALSPTLPAQQRLPSHDRQTSELFRQVEIATAFENPPQVLNRIFTGPVEDFRRR